MFTLEYRELAVKRLPAGLKVGQASAGGGIGDVLLHTSAESL